MLTLALTHLANGMCVSLQVNYGHKQFNTVHSPTQHVVDNLRTVL